jgi:L-alanine-DL-glutamate epimerase-like enolase superfamily enzyme
VVGRDAHAVEAVWQDVYEATALVGRRGAVLRALSVVDIALWDVRAKAAGLPLSRLLGADPDADVAAYVSGGYYREGQTTDDLVREMAQWVERGFRDVKVRVGRLSPAEDAARIAALRGGLGDGVSVAVDANQGLPDAAVALDLGRRLEALGVRWLEEPLVPDDLAGAGRVAAALDLPIAAGEVEQTRWAFRDVVAAGAADVLQPDVTVVGGVTEWMKVATLASTHGLPVAPHYFTEVHAHLVAATPGAIAVEYFYPDADIISFDPLLVEPLVPRDGRIAPSGRPGVGLDLDPAAVERFRTVHEVVEARGAAA